MRPTRKMLSSIIAVFLLVSVGCGSTSDGIDAATSTTTAAATSTEPPVTTETTEPPTTSATTEPSGTTVTVFFSTGDGSDCAEVSPFTRTSGHDGTEVEAALLELIGGPTEEEIAAGASSFFSSETATSLTYGEQFSPGLLVIGFRDLQALIPNASTSCGSEALLAQLNSTVLQYVPRVRYEMLRSCELFSNWLQRECMEYTSGGAVPAELTLEERASGSGCEEPIYGLDDGQWFGYAVSVTESEIEFDLACWFDGAAADEAATDDGEESPTPNGYYIRNDEELLATVPVMSTATVSWLPNSGDPATETAVAFEEWVTLRDSRPDQLGLWLTVRDGQVIDLVEQYVP